MLEQVKIITSVIERHAPKGTRRRCVKIAEEVVNELSKLGFAIGRIKFEDSEDAKRT